MKNNELEKVENRIIEVRGQQVILANDVAALYGTTTREVNKAIRNNPDKFPEGYCFTLQSSEKQYVVENFHHLQNLKYSPVLPQAFTEKGLYMLATILKSPVAVETTFAIIETFAKLRELARNIDRLNTGDIPDDQVNKLQSKITRMFNDVFKDPLPVKMRKTLVSFNFGVLKVSVETTREKE